MVVTRTISDEEEKKITKTLCNNLSLSTKQADACNRATEIYVIFIFLSQGLTL